MLLKAHLNVLKPWSLVQHRPDASPDYHLTSLALTALVEASRESPLSTSIGISFKEGNIK